jgi:hypothetical protein
MVREEDANCTHDLNTYVIPRYLITLTLYLKLQRENKFEGNVFAKLKNFSKRTMRTISFLFEKYKMD